MKPELQQEWAEALRSGDYSQANGTLKNTDSYCCLGVLCLLTGYKFEQIPDVDTHRYRVANEVHYPTAYKVAEGDVTGFPSNSMLEKWGLSKKTAEELASMNDSGCTFEEIADIVEDITNYEIQRDATLDELEEEAKNW